MKPHEQRVVDEKNELDAKIESLSKFIATSGIYAALPRADRDLLDVQKFAMLNYSAVLAVRISRFPTTTELPPT